MSKETSIMDGVTAAFIFILATISAILVPFTIIFTLHHQEEFAVTPGSVLILLLCLSWAAYRFRFNGLSAFYFQC